VQTAELDHIDYRDRLVWLGQLRWWAMLSSMVGIGLAVSFAWEFVNAPAVAGGVAVVVLLNIILLVRTRQQGTIGPSELWLHAVTDLVALTWMLAAAGGIGNPLNVLYSFHVVLGALLTGRAGTFIALAGTIIGLSVLSVLERLSWLPSTALRDVPPLLSFTSITVLVGGLGYFALVLAGRLREEQARAQGAAERSSDTLALLEESLSRLKVGLEVYGTDGEMRIQSPVAQRVRTVTGLTDAVFPQERRQLGVLDGGEERIYDVISLGDDDASPTRAVLYVDRTEEKLVQQRHFMLERLATLGRALQGVAHELNTPLTTMQTLARDLSAVLADLEMPEELREDVEESIELLIDESRRCRTLTQSLLRTAHEDGRASPAENLLDVAVRAVRVVGLKADGSDRVELDRPSLRRPLAVDPDRVLQVLMNLIQNALKATEEVGPDGGPHVSLSAEAGGGQLRLRIADRGPGLPQEVRERLFEPFVTTRAAGEGTGLGLYTAHRIARELGGDLSLTDRAGGGTEALLSLPLDEASPPAADDAERQPVLR
jgi:signal transduction histidine kinase